MRFWLTFSLCILLSISVLSFEDTDLHRAYQEISSVRLDTGSTVLIVDYQLSHHNLEIQIDSGLMVFCEPVILDSSEIRYGAYFKGEGRFRFAPPVEMERDQLYRFFHSDSLDRKFKELFLFFSPEIYDELQANSRPTELTIDNVRDKVKDRQKELFKDSSYDYDFELLRRLAYPMGRPFLLVNVEPEDSDRLFYMYNPYLREEVKLAKRFHKIGVDFMEEIISYSQYNVDEYYQNINGRSKEQLKTRHYDIEAAIDRKGTYQGTTTVTFDVTSGPLQLFTLRLFPAILIDSVVNNDGKVVRSYRDKLDISFKNYWNRQVGLMLPEPVEYQDSLKLTFYLSGDVAQKEIGELFVMTGSEWYPRYGFRHRASFDMRFKTDRDYTFVACGNKVDEMKIGDTLVTDWKIVSPTANVAFNIGNMKKYLFEPEDITPVEVYYSKELHNSMANYLASELVAIGKHMEEQVAEDVMNAIRICEYFYGKYPREKLIVGEILAGHGEAFSGFLHLGYSTWINTDPWGNDRMFRAHEVAHQWWGVDVGYETYHDQWLSEGFATYSSLLYLQRIEGNDKFLGKLREYRNDIFSARKYLLGSGEESGPIALGYRTSSSETEGDYGLIVYKKGAYVLHMLRNMLIDYNTMKEDTFLAMMRSFYESNRGKNVTTRLFQKHVERYAGVKLDWFFEQWVYRTQLPVMNFSYEIIKAEDNTFTAKCRIVTEDVKDDFKMYVPIEVKIDDKSKAYVRVFVDSTDFEFTLPGLPVKPKKLNLNPFESVLADVKQ